MKNEVQKGDVLDLTAPYDVVSGDGFLVGALFAVAVGDALTGAAVRGKTVGVFELKKTNAQAWAQGDKIYWDDANKECTTADGAGANELIGRAVKAAVNPSTTGVVRLG